MSITSQETAIAQTAITGGILSNTLLVLGTCFVFAGWSRDIDNFPLVLAKENARMLMTAIASLIVPAGFVAWALSETLFIILGRNF